MPKSKPAASRTQYLRLRGRVWQCSVPVPRPLRKHFGDVRLVRSLRTESLTEAQELRWPVVTELKQRIAAARRQAAGLPPSIMDEARRLREALLAAPEDDEATLWAVQARLEALAEKHGEEKALDVAGIALGEGDAGGRCCTVVEGRSARLDAHRTRDRPYCARRGARSWSGSGVDREDRPQGGTRRDRSVGERRARNVHHPEPGRRVVLLVEPARTPAGPRGNPWKGLKPISKASRGLGQAKRPFTVAEATAAITLRLSTAPELAERGDAGARVPLTGCRAGELLAVQSGTMEEHKAASWINVTAEVAKTASSVRRVPVTSPAGRKLLRWWSACGEAGAGVRVEFDPCSPCGAGAGRCS